MTYDSAGNAITTKLTGSGSKTISTAASYEGGLNRPASTTDAAGTKVTYGYGTKNAQMMALATTITDAYGVKTTTQYDENDRAVETSVADYATLVYNYVIMVRVLPNTNNIISINKTTHCAISGYYSSIQPFTNGLTVRNWLVGQSFSAQYEFGLSVIKLFM